MQTCDFLSSVNRFNSHVQPFGKVLKVFFGIFLRFGRLYFDYFARLGKLGLLGFFYELRCARIGKGSQIKTTMEYCKQMDVYIETSIRYTFPFMF